MTCVARVVTQGMQDGVQVYLVRHPIQGTLQSEPDFIAVFELRSAAIPDFVEMEIMNFEPAYTVVDAANFNYTLIVQIGDPTVVDTLSDANAFRGCSIQMSR